MKNRKICGFLIVLLFSLSLVGCKHNLTDEGRKGIHNSAGTAFERSTNFEAVKSKIGAKNPADSDDIESWKVAHSNGLAAQAKALSDLDTVVNSVPTISVPKSLKK